MFLGKTIRCQRILHKIAELLHVESRLALECRQRAHDIGDLRGAWTNAEPGRFVTQNQQVQNELDVGLVLVLVLVLARTNCQALHKIRHAKGLRQIEQPHRLLGFQHRNAAIVDASELIGAHRAVIRPLHKIEHERDRKNSDDDHQPMTMLAQ